MFLSCHYTLEIIIWLLQKSKTTATKKPRKNSQMDPSRLSGTSEKPVSFQEITGGVVHSETALQDHTYIKKTGTKSSPGNEPTASGVGSLSLTEDFGLSLLGNPNISLSVLENQSAQGPSLAGQSSNITSDFLNSGTELNHSMPMFGSNVEPLKVTD